jgi:hypothetical protein
VDGPGGLANHSHALRHTRPMEGRLGRTAARYCHYTVMVDMYGIFFTPSDQKRVQRGNRYG